MKLLAAGRWRLLGSSACLLGSLALASTASAQPVRATVFLQIGDAPASGDGSAIQSLGYPKATASGKPVIVGGLASDSAYVWLGNQIVWYGSQGPSTAYPDGSSTQGSCGGNDAGNWAFQAQVGGLPTIYTDAGPLIAQDDPAPGFSGGRLIWNLDRPKLDSNGAAYFYAVVGDNVVSVASALFRSTDRTIANTTPILKTGDDLGGFVLDLYGVKPWYSVSRNGSHLIAVVHATGTDGLSVDSNVVAKQGASDGVEGEWDNFDFVDINSGGHYLFSGDTSAATIRDEFIAYDGQISVREDDTVGGIQLLNPATVFGLSINDAGNAAHAWGHNPSNTRTLFYSCDPSNLKNSRKVVTTNDELDLDGDGVADAVFKRLDVATNIGNGIQLTDTDMIYVRAQLNYGASDVQAVVGFPVTCCGDGNVQTGEDCDDNGESATCNADCTAASCGDGKVNTSAGEACDEGANGSSTCNPDCTLNQCGDGVTNTGAGEDCDSGGESATCNADCTVATCGDKQVNASANETCDEGGVATATCDADCTAPRCGDGELNTAAGEVCDDGGESATCDADCSLPQCGDGVLNRAAGEECEDANSSDGDGCSASCRLEGQGNGGSAGSGGSAGAGATSGAGGAQGGSSGNEDGASDDSGCGCRLAGTSRHNLAPWLLLGLGFGFSARRRRAKRALRR